MLAIAMAMAITTVYASSNRASAQITKYYVQATPGRVKNFSQIGLQAPGRMKSASNGGVLKGGLQVLHVAPLGASHMA